MPEKLTLKATGETAERLVDPAQTNGARVEFITTLPMGADGPPLHIHARQSERFEILDGALLLHVGDETIRLAAGESHTVPAGTPHRFENPGPGTARWHVTVEPALNFDYLAAAMIGIANAAYPNLPRPEHMAYVLDQAAGEYYLADTPFAEQDARNHTLAAGVTPDVPGGPMSLKAYRSHTGGSGAS